VQKLPEQTLVSIGRMTVAATDLEHLLAWIGAERAGIDAREIFARPGEALNAAREAVPEVADSVREYLAPAVEACAGQLAIAESALRRVWDSDLPAEAAVFDGIAVQLVRCRDMLQDMMAAEAR
jgi:hypothetical protein